MEGDGGAERDGRAFLAKAAEAGSGQVLGVCRYRGKARKMAGI